MPVVTNLGVFDDIKAQALAKEDQGAFFVELKDQILVHIPGKDRLVVSFDNHASISEDQTETRLPWAYGLIAKRGWGCLGVMNKRNGFYQQPDLHAALEAMRDDGFFKSYPAVSLYGASSGGFGACVFAGLAPNATVVATAPQSSLAHRLAPFETRYQYARRIELWNDREAPYQDAAIGLASAAKAYLFYDPYEVIDAQHLKRLRGANTVVLRCPHFTHKIPPVMRRLGLLKTIFEPALEGTLTPQEFYKAIRARKSVPMYQLKLLQDAMERGHFDLAERTALTLLAERKNWKIRKSLQRIRHARRESQV